MDVIFIEDLARKYSEKRNGKVSEDEAEDLIKIIFKYLSKKLQSNDEYNYNLGAFGEFYKYHNISELMTVGKTLTKEKKLLEKELINKLYGINKKPSYLHNETELLIQNTNNHPIKN